MDISLKHKETRAVQSNPQNSIIPQADNFRNSSFGVENSTSLQENLCNGGEDQQIDITECTNFINDHRPVETICLDEPKSSSSFDGSVSDGENGSGIGDQEVDSALCEDYPLLSLFDSPSELFWMRKKKPSEEWRKFIRPVMWRCKWIELKVKELQSQAQKYDKELDEYYVKKQFELEKQKSEGINTKSLSFSRPTERMKVMKRKMRKRVEETTVIASYMSQHNVFSYAENRKPVSLNDNYCNLADYSTDPKTKNIEDEIEFNSECPYPGFAHHDKIMSELVLKIEKAKLQARQMKKRIGKVVSEHSEKLSTDCNPSSPEKGNGTNFQSAYALSKHTEDLLMSQKAIPVPGLRIQSKEQALIRAATDDENDEIEKDGEEELNYFEKVINEVIGKPDLLSENRNVNSPVPRSRVPTRKRKRQVSWISSSSARRRSAAARRRRTSG